MPSGVMLLREVPQMLLEGDQPTPIGTTGPE